MTRITTIMYDFLPVLIFRFFARLQACNNTGILNTCTRLWQTESVQVTPVDSIKDVVPSFVKVPEFDNTWRRPEDISAETKQ